MEKMNDGGAAFPTVLPTKAASWKEGMTLRDWFAGMALQGLLANCFKQAPDTKSNTFAGSAYEFADAMLKAREANNEPA